MNCMIVEDELPAVKILETHISQFSDLSISGIHHNAMDAFVALQTAPVDILFLDIQLPRMSGVQLLNTLITQPAVIMTTAYREFALEGYELEITDYLLKPISFERFTKAIAKVYKAVHRPLPLPPPSVTPEPLFSAPFIYVKCEREHVKILLDDLLYIESIKNHVRLVTTTATYITLMGLSQIEEKLPGAHFLRIHRSFVVSLRHIDKFTHAYVVIGKSTLPIGTHYKQQFMKWVDRQVI